METVVDNKIKKKKTYYYNKKKSKGVKVKINHGEDVKIVAKEVLPVVEPTTSVSDRATNSEQKAPEQIKKQSFFKKYFKWLF